MSAPLKLLILNTIEGDDFPLIAGNSVPRSTLQHSPVSGHCRRLLFERQPPDQ